MPNEKLSPMEAWERVSQRLCGGYNDCSHELSIIKIALKETIELKQMIRNFNEAVGEPQMIPPNVEKKLKALDILIRIIKLEGDCVFPEYQENDVVSKEEYDLLKEVLL